ncbi:MULTISPECIES: DUF998 domain-containing protein [unclassified Micromonospora]|uniref:DUF998 domain-containing protein n=1 Tax=unclassified Micromonospora TaxID=2617518 RepID=UPI0013D03EA7|nr:MULTISPECIES: DUF998 domain-containing protein [unclassified Micromonospora]NES15844.1 DUF998 domain-containing protein [Micromonospora sp. PPF5-17B]NES57267.1 DUF998 domain-containing protein [Micromonospora sp. PPF5-6]
MPRDDPRPPQDAVTVRQLRLGVGAVGLALPVGLVVGHLIAAGRPTLLDSLSGYYHTEMRDVFVGALCAIGVFLISYRYRWPDDLLGTIAGLLAVVVALFPTTIGAPAGTVSGSDRLVGVVHQVAAAGLFVLLAVFCLFLFTRPDRAGVPPGPSAVRFYQTCGGLILLAILLALASTQLPAGVRHTVKPVLWCETLAVFAFGAAWLAKSDALFRAAGPGPKDPGEARRDLVA